MEQKAHDISCFVTLTYSDENVPNELKPSHLKRFIKKLRKIVDPVKFRYFGVGEYGEQSERPHYHLAIFGLGSIHSDAIEKAWTFQGEPIGFIMVGSLNKDSARYIAGYCIKGLTNKNRKYVKEVLNGRNPEFTRSSNRNGGIGARGIDIICGDISADKYFDQNKIRLLREITIGGKRYPIGRYLTKRVVQRLGLSEKEAVELESYQKELIESYGEKGGHYYSKILEVNKPYVEQIEKRNKIFKQRRKI